jgi:hypothetical protein
VRRGRSAGVAGAVGLGEEQGDVVAGLAGAVGVAAGFVVVDGLLVVMQGLRDVPRLAVGVAELVGRLSRVKIPGRVRFLRV